MLFDINFVRRVFFKFPAFYNLGSWVYHIFRNTCARISCFLNGYRYFSPMTPSESYRAQFGQDRILELLGLLEPQGIFVEVGSNHPVNNSNSYYLESKLGYSGISVDPIDYSDLFRMHRPKTQFINAAIDSSNSLVTLNLVKASEGWEDQVSSLHSQVIYHGRGFEVQQLEVPAITLSSVCKGLNHINILLLDVEGHEIDVLESLDWSRIKPCVVLSENTGQFYPRKQLENFMYDKGYRLVARIGSSDDIYQIRDEIRR